MKTMKYCAIGVICILFQFTAISQGGVSLKNSSELINRFPSEANGYLILNNYDYPDVVKWEINFLRPVFSSNGNITNFEIDRVVELDETYFTNQADIPNNSDYYGYMNIVGYNNLGSVVASDGPIIYACVGCEQELYCRPGCNGKTPMVLMF